MLLKEKNKLINLLNKFRFEKSLKARVARGGFWLGIGSSVEQFLRFLRNIILVRVLVPEAFGTMAIILAVNMFFEAFTEVGIKEAIIQNPRGDKDEYLIGAWLLAVIRSVFLFSIAFILAPYIAEFYKNPKLTEMLYISYLFIIFRGFMSPKAYVALKKMEFKKWIAIEHLGGIIGVLTAIVLSFYLFNAWALIIGFVVEGFARLLLSHIICPFKPKFVYRKEDVKSLLVYAKGMFGLPILTFIFQRIDVFVIGKLCSTELLGLYSMALALANIPSLLFSKFIAPLLTPAFSEMQTDNKRINKSVLAVTSISGYIGIPLVVFVAINAKTLLTLLYTSQYAQIYLAFAVLFGVKMFNNFSVPIASVYFAIGRPELQRLFSLFRAFMIIILIYPAVKFFGLLGAAMALLISMGLAFVVQLMKIKKIITLDIGEYSKILLKALYISIPVLIISTLSIKLVSSNLILSLGFSLLGLMMTYYFSFINIIKFRSDNVDN